MSGGVWGRIGLPGEFHKGPDDYARQVLASVADAAERSLQACREDIERKREELRGIEEAERRLVGDVNEIREIRGVPAREVARGARLMSDYLGPG